MSRDFDDVFDDVRERLNAEIERLEAEIERLRDENRDLRDGFGVDEWWRLEKAETVIQRVQKVRDRYAARAEEYDEKVRQYGPLGMGAMFARDRDLARQVVQAIVHALEAETDD